MADRTVFKWVKQHLRIKVFWGESSNAVKTQIWVAVCTLCSGGDFAKNPSNLYKHERNVTNFKRISFRQNTCKSITYESKLQKQKPDNPNQLILFGKVLW